MKSVAHHPVDWDVCNLIGKARFVGAFAQKRAINDRSCAIIERITGFPLHTL
jgi:hypothetical protein